MVVLARRAHVAASNSVNVPVFVEATTKTDPSGAKAAAGARADASFEGAASSIRQRALASSMVDVGCALAGAAFASGSS
ncbi:hypothetical protein [Nannocystis pusilla]|uniref:hypothetical protein n=1 Tax=Nannocystis pusilla TaxID=889268 RepID=UPI003DA2EEFA